jgi:PAS domain S-box-containing protein
VARVGRLGREVNVGCEEFALVVLTGTEAGSPECDLPVEERERVLRALMGRIPAMIYRCADDAQWTMEFVSAGAEELTGYKPDELVGNARLAYTDLVVPWHYEGVCRDIQAAIEKHNAWTTSYPIITATGDRKWVWERGVAVLDEEGRVRALEGLIVDMTAEREAEEALEVALVEWQQVFDAMDESVMVLDADGTVVRANAATAVLSGYFGDIVGARCCEIFHGPVGVHPDCPRERALRSGQAETTYIRRDDRLLRFTFKPTRAPDGRAGGGVHVVTDVTDLERSLAAPRRGAATR